MNPETQSLKAAILRAVQQDPSGLHEIVNELTQGEHLAEIRDALQGTSARALLDEAEKVAIKMGRHEVFAETTERVRRIAIAYLEAEELQLANAFNRFGQRLTEKARAELVDVDAMLKRMKAELEAKTGKPPEETSKR